MMLILLCDFQNSKAVTSSRSKYLKNRAFLRLLISKKACFRFDPKYSKSVLSFWFQVSKKACFFFANPTIEKRRAFFSIPSIQKSCLLFDPNYMKSLFSLQLCESKTLPFFLIPSVRKSVLSLRFQLPKKDVVSFRTQISKWLMADAWIFIFTLAGLHSGSGISLNLNTSLSPWVGSRTAFI